MIRLWKVPHIFKGLLSVVGPLNAWHFRRGHTGGSDHPQYCLKTWTGNLRFLCDAGFDPRGTRMVELGPGDTIGVGLAALLTGVSHYTGLDAVPFSRNFDPVPFFDELCHLASKGEISFPVPALSPTQIQQTREALERGINGNDIIRYEAPWTAKSVPKSSVDLVFSEGVLQHVDNLEEAFQTIYGWLRAGGYSCHGIPLTALFLSPFWNGHWAYSDLEWRLVRGGRTFLINRHPVSTYLKVAKAVGFEVLTAQTRPATNGLPQLPQSQLAARFRNMDHLDSNTIQLRVVLRKPAHAV